jgi:hypothetical protein
MPRLALACALLALFVFTTVAISTRLDASAGTTAPAGPASAASGASVLVAIARYQDVTWRWQRVMGKQRIRSAFQPLRNTDPAYRAWVLRLWKQRASRVQLEAWRWSGARIRSYQGQVEHLERVMRLRFGPVRQTASASSGLSARYRLLLKWKARAQARQRQFAHPPHESAWRCIHRYEGSWRDGGAPYYGGLQMDIGFQRAYGGYLLGLKGTADNWSPEEQMWVAVHALRSGRGFHPWPHTARMCGLI